MCTATHTSYTTKARDEYHHPAHGRSSNTKLQSLLGKHGVRLCQPSCGTGILTGYLCILTPDTFGGLCLDVMPPSLATRFLNRPRSQNKLEHPERYESDDSSLLEQGRYRHMKGKSNVHSTT